MKKLSINTDEYIEYFRKNTGNPKPIAKLFKTDSCFYIYDTGTSKVLNCSELEYKILEKIIAGKAEEILSLRDEADAAEFSEALINIKAAIEGEDILKAGSDNFKFVSLGHFEELDYELDNKVRQVVLEITGKCNLRCSYCIYSSEYVDRRDFNEGEMTEDIARRAIDYINLHGDKEMGVAVTFYGGEPLIKFDLLKSSIEYARKTITDKKLTFSLTSNLTLMTKEIAEYLASVDGLTITCSIDGPKEIHDSSRIDINGRGSFDRAIRGLRYIVDAFGSEAESRMTLSMVFNVPYSYEKIEVINDFFKGLDWLPEGISKKVTYPTISNINYEKLEEMVKKTGGIPDYLRNWSDDEFVKNITASKESKFFLRDTVESPFSRIHQRTILVNHINGTNLNACCVPGGRKIYVTTNGDFMICEKVDGSPIIGNVYDGMDKEKIRKLLVQEYAEKSKDDCKNCWASRICEVCYAMMITNGEFDMNKKRYYCGLVRKNMERYLKLYHKCMEINPKGLEYLNDITLG